MAPLAAPTIVSTNMSRNPLARHRANTLSQSTLDTDASRTVRVTMTSDLLCPWCYIGLKKLQLAHGDDIEVAITFRPFLIQPHIPASGVPTGGTPESRVSEELREAANKVGLSINGLCNRTPDSKLFHACIEHLQKVVKEAQTKEVQDDESLEEDPSVLTQSDVVQFFEKVCEGYHSTGIYPDQEGLIMMAMMCEKKQQIVAILRGLFEDKMQLLQLQDHVHEEAMSSIRQGILSVPHFRFNKKKTFSGAQPMETFALFEETFAE